MYTQFYPIAAQDYEDASGNVNTKVAQLGSLKGGVSIFECVSCGWFLFH